MSVAFSALRLEAEMKTLRHVRFMPFVGDSYGYDSPFGIPVMVLGESHYSEKNHEGSSLTSDVMKKVMDGARWNFITRVSATFLGKQSVDARSFWNSVVFYNFVQTAIKKNSRPTKQIWVDSEQPFCEVLDWLDPRPGLIAVCGVQCWDSTPCYGRDTKPIIDAGQDVPCYEFGPADSRSLAFRLPHPSRISPQKWHPIFLKALRRAGGHEFKL
jgi:hypothetical protein